MALATEALGMMLPGAAAVPAVHAERRRIAEETGARAIAMATEKLTPDKIVTARSITNALRVVLAAGGSTNALIHLTAIAGRAGIKVDLDGFDRLGRETPVLVDLTDRPGLHGRSAPGRGPSDDPERDEIGAAPGLPDRDWPDAG
jgi:dihydroxy-acid dehydratase